MKTTDTKKTIRLGSKKAGRNRQGKSSSRSGADKKGGQLLEKIMRLIEDDMVSEKIRPGQRLDERELAQRFGVSRTPVREVLVRMSSLGIVELRRNRGAFVAALTSAKLISMLEVMAELKILAARLASRRMTVAEREALLAIKEETAASVTKGDFRHYFEQATALHDAVYVGSHNSVLLDTARNITMCLCAYRAYVANALHMPIHTSYEENKNMVDAVVRGDAAEAERWMRQHTELRREELEDLITAVSSAQAKLAPESRFSRDSEPVDQVTT